MEIILSNASPKPIYEQITSQIKAMIMNGELKAGDPMPSMRKLAKELHVSVITTQRAYDDLQKDGFIVTVPAKGTFVSAQNQDFIREENRRRVELLLTDAVELAKENGIELEELRTTLRRIVSRGGCVMEFALEVKGLRKTYKEFGLKNISMKLPKGLCARARSERMAPENLL